MSKSLLRSIVLGCALLSMAGCATYTEKRAASMPADQVGTLEQPNAVRSGILVDYIDGHWVGARPRSGYILAPGEHALSVRANVPFYSSDEKLAYFDVTPGGRYRVDAMASTAAAEWGFAIVDEATGKRVDRAWSNQPGDQPAAAHGKHANPPRAHY
jgi:hypothetical protein